MMCVQSIKLEMRSSTFPQIRPPGYQSLIGFLMFYRGLITCRSLHPQSLTACVSLSETVRGGKRSSRTVWYIPLLRYRIFHCWALKLLNLAKRECNILISLIWIIYIIRT